MEFNENLSLFYDFTKIYQIIFANKLSVLFEGNNEQTMFIVRLGDSFSLPEKSIERMRRWGFLRQSIDWSSFCSFKFIRFYRAILQPMSVFSPTNTSNFYCRILANPVSEEIDLQMFSPVSTHCHIKLFDMRGTQVMTVFDGIIEKGELSLSTKTTGIPSGQYILVLQTPTERVHRFIAVLH